MKPPPAEKAWLLRFPNTTVQINKTWKIKFKYATGRDIVTWLKLRHRTLYTANKDKDCPNPKCLACNRVDESMKHLAECSVIRFEFWWDIINMMRILKIEYSNTPTFIILGITEMNGIACKEGAAILAIAWRCLYAEITRARIEDTALDLNKALRRTFALLISRVKAYGEKWKLWYNKQRMQAHARIIAAKYRQLALIDQDEEGKYTVASALIKAYEEAKD